MLGILAVAIGAAALRLPRLALRPMHGDEANQALKTATLLETGRYAYNPHDHHGPSLYYLALPALWAAGVDSAPEMTDGLLRLTPALFGVLAVLLLVLLAGGGRAPSPSMGEGRGEGAPPRAGLAPAAAVCAGVLAAVSPALVFYSRYYVQEMLLVCFTFAAVATGWRYVATRKIGWAVAAGASVGLMHATKETWVLAGAAMAGALVLVLLWERYGHRRVLEVRSYLRPAAVAGAFAAAVVVTVVLYTSFFTHARGPLDSVLTYWYNVSKAGGESIHVHPWHWYLSMLACSRLVTDTGVGPWWSEGLILGLALVGTVAAFSGRGLGRTHRGLARFLGLYTILLTAAYAVIPYKTPWCAASFLHAMTLMGGVGAVALVRWVPTRPVKVLAAVALVAGAVHLGWQAHRASFRFGVDQRNPYVYAHTSPDAMDLVRRVEEVAEVHPDGREMVVKVITPTNYWPLPWYLRAFPHVGYYHDVPANADAAVIVTSPEWTERVAARTERSYNQASLYGLRPQVLLSVWIHEPLWDALVEKWSAKQQAGAGRSTGPPAPDHSVFAAALARRVLFGAPAAHARTQEASP
ncbi:MAG: phospholipid carrier-dependent glycosyltransferase [Phycisphaerae bacterium]